ncbi:MAG TPA: class I SAM-dependent methyltransferase [Candidatus Acidoferrales bacterium]|nr:class I SAM-dependent methyltransferase [Candidatus Acidoferrales bacterium]
MTIEREHLDRVRSRFTSTAELFARFALRTRAKEAGRLAQLAAPPSDQVALDLACGPGTFTRAFAARVRFLMALDLTPAMLEQARQAAQQAGLANIGFACADANALPLPDSALGMAVCGYALHHFFDPARPIGECARVLRRGGRVAIADLIVPEGANPEWNNRIERARDSSHATTLTLAELHGLLRAAGLDVVATELLERQRRFDDWMAIIGSPEGTPAYVKTRGLMEASLANDAAGFHPRQTERNEIEFVQTSALVVAERR